jgi:hypothetical protein
MRAEEKNVILILALITLTTAVALGYQSTESTRKPICIEEVSND